MRVDFRSHSESHYWITVLWCAFGAVILGAIAVFSYWIRRCRFGALDFCKDLLFSKSDITGGPTLHAARSEEVIISCQRQLQYQKSAAPLQALPLKRQNPKLISRSQSSKVIQELHSQHAVHQLKQQQSLPQPLHAPHSSGTGGHHPTHSSKSVSILVYKTLNTVFKSSRKIIVRVCEVASVKKSFTMFKFNKAAAQHRAESRANNCTGHDQFVRPPVSDKKAKHIMKKLHKQNGLKRSNSAIEFDASALSAVNRRQIYSCNRSASSEQDNSDQSEHSEKSPLVSARLDNLARLFFSKSMPAETGSRDTIESVLTTRPNLKYQYSALDSGNGVVERSPRERAHRERALSATQEWVKNSNGRYEVIIHLDEIGSRHSKNWFLVNDSSVRTDRLMTLLPLPPDCVALDDLPPNESPRGVLMELLGSLHHPYIYPVLDLGFLSTGSTNYACLVTPFNSRGSLKDLIYKAQWNEPWSRKYTRKPSGLPASQIQRLGRQILEALLFLKERGFPLHGHLHSGNVILQNGAARLSGLENGLLGLSSRVNAVMWSRSTTEIENVDIICFGHLLYEMCTGLEMTTPKPSMRALEMELDSYPQILDILGLIFDPPAGVCPSVEELVLCDLFRSIDLRELRGPCFSTIKPSLSRSTLNLLHAVKKRQCASLGNSLSETSSPCTPPSTPRDRRSGTSRTMDSFEISSDSEEGLLDEIVVGGGHNHHYPHFPKVLRMDYRQPLSHHQQQQHPAAHHLQLHHLRSISQKPPSQSQSQCQRPYDPLDSPIHHCDNSAHSDDNSFGGQENQNPNQNQIHHNQQPLRPSTSSSSNLSASLDGPVGSSGTSTSVGKTMAGQLESEAGGDRAPGLKDSSIVAPVTAETQQRGSTSNHAHSNASAGALFNHQLTADMCNYKNSKSRRLEYSLKCLKYGRSNPSQDSAFGSLTDGDLSTGSSSFRLSSFQSISSPIDEGVEDIIIATTSAGNETCLELATIPTHMVSQDSAISSPCRESSPSNFLTIDDVTSGSISSGSSGSSSSGTSGSNGSNGHVRPQQFPVSLSPKILVTATTNSSSSSLASTANNGATSQQLQQQQQQQFDPPKILVNDQNSIYTTSPSKRSGTIEVFSQKYRVSSFEDMSPNKRSTATGSGSASASASASGSGSAGKHLKHHSNRTAFRSLEEERRIDSAFMPIRDRTNSEHLVNMQSEKYKKLTHASFRISKTSSQVSVCAETSQDRFGSTREAGSTSAISGGGSDGGDVDADPDELSRPATASGSISSRQTMWRDSKFYRKNRIAKSNDSLLESSPNHSTRLSPSSLRDNHYDSCSSYGSAISGSRQSLNRGCSINEISGSNQALGMSLGVAINVCGISGSGFGFGSASGSGSGSGSGSTGNNRRYCSSKSEDLGEPNDYLRVMDARKSYSERHLLSLTTLKQTAITTTMGSNENLWLSGDEASSNEENSPHRQQWGNENMPSHHHQGRHKNQQHQQQQQQQQQQHQHQLQYHSHSHVAQPAKPHSQPHYGRPHPNHLSLSTCSINRIATTKIRTTSLATLSSHQSLANTNTSNTNTNTNFNGSAKSDNKTEGSSKASSDGDCEVDGPGTATEENSSTDESPSHLIMSGAELSRIFAADEAQGSSCSEEKTPLLDSVEMSPISPTEPDHGHDRGRGEQM